MTDRGGEGAGNRQGPDRDLLLEIEEIFDSLAARLNDLETGLAQGSVRSGLINVLFREVHTLKGLAGLLESSRVPELAHDLEEHLDRLRMGRLSLDHAAVDRIHEAVDAMVALVRGAPTSEAREAELVALRACLRTETGSFEAPSERLEDLPLDQALRRSLTEYEEQRLESALREGLGIFLVRVGFAMEECDAGLRTMVGRVEPIGEMITTFPLLDESPDGQMVFALLVATARGDQLTSRLTSAGAVIEPLTGRASSPAREGSDADLSGEVLHGQTTSSLRIPISRLDDILNQVADLGVAVAALRRAIDRAVEAVPVGPEMQLVETRIRDLAPRMSILQRSTVESRLVPIGQVFGRLSLMVSREARSAGKEIDLVVSGAATEIDKAVADALATALMHLLRNAVDHGIETPADRESAGKARRARLRLDASRRGSRIVIAVEDDGRGIDGEKVRAAAIAAGRIGKDATLSESEILGMIFEPGFSTASRVSRVSGRGVGLDAVRQSVHRLKGSVDVSSRAGQGTTFTLNMPLTLLLVEALIVASSGRRFAILTSSIRENLRLDRARLRRIGKYEFYDHPLGTMPVLRLRHLLPGARGDGEARDRFAVVAGTRARPISLLIDELVGHQEVMIKPLGDRLGEIPGVVGATDLGDSTAVLVLDPEGLARREAGDARAAN
ncbi:MAG: ATP-binding protein [Acidobacteria bacterium]|nr:ATP-binding protein [Acidobacteriota bacterium]